MIFKTARYGEYRLTNTEQRIKDVLNENPGKILSAEQIAEQADVKSATSVRTHISKMRRKGVPGITTIYGGEYHIKNKP